MTPTDASRGDPITTVALESKIDLALSSTRLRWPELRRYPYGSVYGLESGVLALLTKR